MGNEISDILKRLEQQRELIEQAILLLERFDRVGPEQIAPPTKRTRGKKARKKSSLSPEARERIASAQRKRWAASKKAVKKKSVKNPAKKSAS
jgi:hypothetical protein